jgi:hypothetical protein
MKKDILLQRQVHAKIIPYKDYCNIDEKPKQEATSVLWGANGDDEITHRSTRIHFHDKDTYSKKNSKIFYASKGDSERNLNVYSKLRAEIYTTDDAHIKKHFGKPFSEITVRLNEKSIREDENKLYVRRYWHTKSRHVNCRYFKRSNGYSGFTFNKKNGNFISYIKQPGQNLSMRQNSFDHLSVVLDDIVSTQEYFNRNKYTGAITKKTIEEYDQIFSRSKFIKELHLFFGKIIKNDVEDIPGDLLFDETTSNPSFYPLRTKKQYTEFVLKLVMRAFIDVKEIKVPNTYFNLLTKWYPTKPFLVKNDNKLVLSILDRVGIKSKSLNKLIHSKDNFLLEQLIVLIPYFGKSELSKYVPNITQNYFNIDWKDIIGDVNMSYQIRSFKSVNELKLYDLKPTEKTTVLRYLNDFFDNFLVTQLTSSSSKLISRIFRELNDHFNMIEQVRYYYPNTEMRATNQLDFHAEHIELSKIQNSIKKGYTIQYTFPEEFISYIEEPILGVDENNDEMIFYPVLLKSDSEYTEEGSHMHHCVGSYADKEDSVIVSLRIGTTIGSERVTSEFSTHNKTCVQSKYFCNAKPPKIFEVPLEELLNRIDFYEKSIKSIKKEKVPLVINGIVVAKEKTTQDYFTELLGQDELPNWALLEAQA